MLDVRDVTEPAQVLGREPEFHGTSCTAAQSTLEALVRGLPLQRRRLRAKQYVFRAGKYVSRVRIDDPGRHDRDVNLRVTPGGRLLTIEEAAQCDPRR